MRAFTDYYRCPDVLTDLRTRPDLGSEAGYFRCGEAIAFGRLAGARPSPDPGATLPDVAAAPSAPDTARELPFDISEVATNLREERYRSPSSTRHHRTHDWTFATDVYYWLRPLLGIGVRKHLQRARLSDWRKLPFPQWPVDRSVDTLMAYVMSQALRVPGAPSRIPFVWFWPSGAPACAMVTHDVEGPAGVDFCDTLMDIDDAHGIKSSFQLIPQGRGDQWRGTSARLRARGFEVNLHDLSHDGRLFSSKASFLRRATRINEYARAFDCRGFRAGAMYREQSWFAALDFSYDMSVPNVAHLDPQRGGCCTVMPYFVDRMLELPLTTVQDYTLFFILNDYSTTLWRQQIQLIRERHGLISVIAHPDYLRGAREQQVYTDLLRLLATLRDTEGVWLALPAHIDAWWRARAQMQVVRAGNGWRIEGPDSTRARLAYASLDNGQLVYHLDKAGAAPSQDLAALA